MCVFSELYQSLQQLPAAAVTSVSVQSDWGRFLYDAFSLCEHPLTVGIVETLTVVNCCIFSLNSTDGQSEVRSASTATKPSWCSWFTCAHICYQELWSLSRFLLIPEHIFIAITICKNILVGLTGQRDSGSWSRCHYWRLSHSHLTAASCRQRNNKSVIYHQE